MIGSNGVPPKVYPGDYIIPVRDLPRYQELLRNLGDTDEDTSGETPSDENNV